MGEYCSERLRVVSLPFQKRASTSRVAFASKSSRSRYSRSPARTHTKHYPQLVREQSAQTRTVDYWATQPEPRPKRQRQPIRTRVVEQLRVVQHSQEQLVCLVRVLEAFRVVVEVAKLAAHSRKSQSGGEVLDRSRRVQYEYLLCVGVQLGQADVSGGDWRVGVCAARHEPEPRVPLANVGAALDGLFGVHV